MYFFSLLFSLWFATQFDHWVHTRKTAVYCSASYYKAVSLSIQEANWVHQLHLLYSTHCTMQHKVSSIPRRKALALGFVALPAIFGTYPLLPWSATLPSKWNHWKAMCYPWLRCTVGISWTRWRWKTYPPAPSRHWQLATFCMVSAISKIRLDMLWESMLAWAMANCWSSLLRNCRVAVAARAV